jgi:di/tricarboxylate transporter
VEVVRGSELLSPVAPTQRLEAGDRLIFSGDITRVGTLDRFHGLKLFAVEEGLLSTNMTEVVIMPNAAVAGQTIKQTSFRAKFDAAVVGLKRDGERLSGKLGSIALRPGDSLMLAVGPDFQYRGNLRKNFLVVDDSIDSASLPLFPSLFVSGTLIAVVISAAAGLLPLIKGLAFLLAGMLALGVVSGGDLRRRFPFEMWLIISSALVVSQALYDSGLIEGFIATAAPLLADVSPIWALVAVYLLTLVLTELMTNNAAAAMVFPLAYSLALSTGADPMAFVMAVAFGASASFVTPFGYTTNLMVQNLGGYRRLDYLRMGAPVSLVYSAVVLSLLTVVFPLTP